MSDGHHPKVSSDPLLHRVLEDEQRRGDAILAKDRLFDVLEGGKTPRRLIAYLSGRGNGTIDLADAAPIGSMLDAIGNCNNLDLLLNSPGGYGEAAEKIIQICRDHCRRQFRVLVPNYAKSAATLIALGADKIVMGYLSELGPIDPQVTMVVSGAQQMVSAQSVLQAEEMLHQRIKEAAENGESPASYLHQLQASSMEPAFIDHCRRGVEFSRDLTQKFLPRYQLKKKYAGRPGYVKKRLESLAAQAAENLLSREARFSHGRLIDAEEARDDIGLNVEVLARDDPTWEACWELYVRSEVYMQSVERGAERPVSKLFMDRDSTLPAF